LSTYLQHTSKAGSKQDLAAQPRPPIFQKKAGKGLGLVWLGEDWGMRK